MNIPLLRKIQANILAKPEKFNMDVWMRPSAAAHKPVCGTACCIGGWALVEKGYKVGLKHTEWDNIGEKSEYFISPTGKEVKEYVIPDKAAKILGLTKVESHNLFYTLAWPEPFQTLNASSEPLVRASNAVMRIEHFIETGE